MKARRPPPRHGPHTLLDPGAIDALYGLEPVFEPSASASARPAGDEATLFTSVQCPYCGEAFETLVDLSAGSSVYIEDCQICCQPIELAVDIDLSGALSAMTARRTD